VVIAAARRSRAAENFLEVRYVLVLVVQVFLEVRSIEVEDLFVVDK